MKKPTEFFTSRVETGLVLVVVLILTNACGPSGPPFSPREALKKMKIEKGFRIELFASESDVASPVAMEIDENGRVYVVEMPGYPLDTRPTGRIKMLEDTSGDGRPDRTTVFAEGIVLPTGVMRWEKGILVTAAPNVWYFEDTNGDGRADIRKVVLTGFAFTNPQHTVNGPLYGPDNWIHLAHSGVVEAVITRDVFGDRGTPIRFPERPDIPGVNVGEHSLRFRLDTFQLEAHSGDSQFGHAFDEWGHYLTVDNSNHARHEVIDARYLKQNPDLLLASSMQDVSDHGNAAKVYPITRRPEFQIFSDVGQFTSACSLTPYRGGAFPAEFNRVTFVAEPVHNLVHRDVWSEAGSTYTARRAEDGVEFLASTDAWFRPVNFYVGPDGALYIVDYYRPIIEHPEWTTTEVKESKELYRGADRGRIYRIVPHTGPPLPLPGNIRLGEASEEELVRQLGNPNLWWRRTAQRLLVDRKSPTAPGLLVRLFQESPSPLARLHALWTLEGLGKLDTALVEKALGDPEPGLRENAIRLAEPRMSTSPALVERLLRLGADANPKVKFQLLSTLGLLGSPRGREVQEKLLFENVEDRWMQVAALAASSERFPHFFDLAVSPRSPITGKETEGRAWFLRQVASGIGARQKSAEVRRVLEVVARESRPGTEWWRAASLEGLARGVRAQRVNASVWKGRQDVLLESFASPAASVRRAALELLRLGGLGSGHSLDRALQQAEATARNKGADAERRADSIGLLALAGAEPRAGLLRELVDPQEPEPVQSAAVRALGALKGEELGRFFLDKWRALAPRARSEAAEAMIPDPGRATLLLAALRKEEIQSWTLEFRQKQHLMMHRDAEVRQAARALLEQPPEEREKVLRRYDRAVDLEGDAARGERVYKRVCAKCHPFNGQGAEVGPDLGTVRNRPRSVLLTDIIIPSRSIAQRYESYVVETASGEMLEGVMGPETLSTISLRREEGKEAVVLRKNIKRMYLTNLSAMPADVEQQVSVEQMAHLLEYLTTAR